MNPTLTGHGLAVHQQISLTPSLHPPPATFPEIRVEPGSAVCLLSATFSHQTRTTDRSITINSCNKIRSQNVPIVSVLVFSEILGSMKTTGTLIILLLAGMFNTDFSDQWTCF